MTTDPINHAGGHLSGCPMILWPERGECACSLIDQQGNDEAEAEAPDRLETIEFDTIN
ncbi:hypothetical protein ACFXAZ_12130 [Streptomyces sp. NPDC059477]|uniref:hypothetical protein n=1 Tax=Streptomyces sp. NPDC059477 TaxID=3346847 RepID=UPI0036757BC1